MYGCLTTLFEAQAELALKLVPDSYRIRCLQRLVMGTVTSLIG